MNRQQTRTQLLFTGIGGEKIGYKGGFRHAGCHGNSLFQVFSLLRLSAKMGPLISYMLHSIKTTFSLKQSNLTRTNKCTYKERKGGMKPREWEEQRKRESEEGRKGKVENVQRTEEI